MRHQELLVARGHLGPSLLGSILARVQGRVPQRRILLVEAKIVNPRDVVVA
jgi:hypothetical protein